MFGWLPMFLDWPLIPIETKVIATIKSNFEIKDEIIRVVDYIKQSQYFDEKEFRKRISKLKI